MSETVQPLGPRVLLEIPEEEAVTASGLVIPDTARSRQQRGVVVAIGDDEELIKVKVGDLVLFPQYSGTSITLERRDYLLIDATELLAVIRPA